uniref:Uncharacterized protein n=1 Tax=Knipowitschia caucasica TaxID=637954 RepID=A0AAV2J8D0_KNICA
MGGLTVVTGILSLLLPESRGLPLPETMDQIQTFRCFCVKKTHRPTGDEDHAEEEEFVSEEGEEQVKEGEEQAKKGEEQAKKGEEQVKKGEEQVKEGEEQVKEGK